MAKGYMVADLHVRDEVGLEKFREMAKLNNNLKLYL